MKPDEVGKYTNDLPEGKDSVLQKVKWSGSEQSWTQRDHFEGLHFSTCKLKTSTWLTNVQVVILSLKFLSSTNKYKQKVCLPLRYPYRMRFV